MGKDKFLAGHFLVSNAMMEDPNFSHTVVLLIEHNEEGAFGLTVNRPSSFQLSDLVTSQDLDSRLNDRPVYFGGPVQQNNLFYLFSADDPQGKENLQVCPEVFLGASHDLLRAVPGEVDIRQILFFLGYAGWGPGQLESEMKEKSWITVGASREIIFSEEPESSWRQALHSKGGIYRFFARNVEDPELN